MSNMKNVKYMSKMLDDEIFKNLMGDIMNEIYSSFRVPRHLLFNQQDHIMDALTYIVNPIIVYINPDGTQRANKPRDGEIFWYGSKDYHSDRVWQWEGTQDQWVDVTDKLPADSVKIEAKEEAKCECGSEKVGSSAHSSWCAKYNINSQF